MLIKLTDLMWAWDQGEDTIGSSGVAFCCEGEYLICKRADSGEWSVPWGRIKEGDDPLESAVREVMEEVGIAISMEEGEDRPELIHKYTHDGRPCYLYHAPIAEKPDVYLNFEHTEYKWCKPSQFPKDMWAEIKKGIKEHCKKMKEAKK